MRAKTEQDLTALREKRAQRNATRNAEAAKMSLEALTFMMQTWGSLAESDEEMKGYCEKQRDAYQEMIDAKKENARQATPETRRASQPQTPTRAAPSRPRTTPFVTTEEKKKTQSRTPTPSGNSRPPASFTARGRHDMPRPSASNFNPTRAFPRTNTPPPPTESWAQVKERREAAKAAHLEAKAKAVREEKEKLAKKKEVAEKEEKERVTRARAKAHEKKDSVVSDKDTWMDEAEKTATSGKGKSPGGKECQLCGDVHVSLADWKKCAKRRGEDEESGGFFRAA
ncbi:hypothetical protein P280DRAFT_471896 [Massarina eburnea CBS 473.64]|uniref:Uncharacterized protein n=1 Tax=Massarina eburnea CBS 473.64 TaxID=1395130 RepID=A0A6A6RU01_9PLEO|nr:hypothetical protein P280DRAFT_471896 [Massarina eburnea CBS 473.64]